MSKTCFIISSIGEKNSETRINADEKFDLVFEPVLKELGFDKVERADKIGSPGSISYDIVNHIINSDLVIADVSDLNPNVFYELAIRNAIQKPVVVIKAEGQKMPFDIYDKRAISLDMTNARQWITTKNELKEQIKNATEDPETASKSILSEFSGFKIDASGTGGNNSDIRIELKDMQSDIRRIYDEVRRPRTVALSPKEFEERRRLRKNRILDFVQYERKEKDVMYDKISLRNEIRRKLKMSSMTVDRYIDELISEGELLVNADDLITVDND